MNSYHCPLKCIYWFGLCRVFTAAQAFPWLPPTGAAVQLGCVGPQCRGSSCCGAWAGGRSGFSGRAGAPQLLRLLSSAHGPQQLKSASTLEPVPCNKRSHLNQKPTHHSTAAREHPWLAVQAVTKSTSEVAFYLLNKGQTGTSTTPQVGNLESGSTRGSGRGACLSNPCMSLTAQA